MDLDKTPMPDQAAIDANRVSIINKEIEGSLQTIHQGKKILVNFITLYITAVFGFFYYGAYVQSKVTENIADGDTPKNEYFILGLIGILLVLIIFVFGGALLGLVTRTVFATIKQYKHISYMRNLYCSIFPSGIFQENCLNPLANTSTVTEPSLPIRVAQSLPFLFAMVNAMFLASSFYYLKLFLSTNEATTIFLLPAGLFALFYANLLAKHYTEITIVQEITPTNNEKDVRIKFIGLKQEQKNMQRYRYSFVILQILSIAYFCSLGVNLYQKIKFDHISAELLTWQGGALVVMGVLSFVVTLIKIETTVSFKVKPAYLLRKNP